MSDSPRPIRPVAFAADRDHLYVVDEVIPVVVEVAISTGTVTRTYTFGLSSEHRGMPTATDLKLLNDAIIVASPAAGGLVRIRRETGDTSLVSLEEPAGYLVVAASELWAVGGPDLRAEADERAATEPTGLRRSVLWEEPTDAEIARWGDQTSGWFASGPEADPDEWIALADEPRTSAADWREAADDDQDVIARPTPIWRVIDDTSTRSDLGGEVVALAALNGHLVAVCWLPSDPLIKRVEPGGYLSYIRPASVLVRHPDGQIDRIGSVAESGGEVWTDGDKAWLLGFVRGELDDRMSEVRPVDVEAGSVGDSLPINVRNPIAVVGDRVAELMWDLPGPWDTGGEDDEDNDDFQTRHVLRFVPVDARQDAVVAIGPVDDECTAVGGTLWFRRVDAPVLVGVDAHTMEVDEISIDIDCRPFAPSAVPPLGVDLEGYERSQIEALRGSLFGGWRTDDDEERPFIDGITFESVELHGAFPLTEIAALFRANARPGMRFGRRWALYDDLGNLTPQEYADIELMEDIESAGYGLPPLDGCLPDADGIVWF